MQAKLLTYTNNDAMTEDASDTLTVSVVWRYKLPVVPGRAMLNGWLAGSDVSESATYQVRWSRRRSDYLGIVLESDELDLEQEGVSYNVYVKQGGSNKFIQYGVLGNELSFDGSLVDLGEAGIEIEAISDAGNSMVTRRARFTITL